jgi:hypothetical protein
MAFEKETRCVFVDIKNAHRYLPNSAKSLSIVFLFALKIRLVPESQGCEEVIKVLSIKLGNFGARI